MTTVSEAVEQRAHAPARVSPREALRQLLDSNAAAVGASLPTGYQTDRFVRLLLTAANTNPELFECDPRSFLAAGVGAAQLGLEPNDARGLCYLVPFRDKKRGKVVQLIIGYRGMMELARRSGLVTAIAAHPVYETDRFSYSFGLSPTLEHVPDPDSDQLPAQLRYVYAVARVGAADHQFVVLTRKQIDRVRDQYARSEQSPWHTHFVEMAQKTAIRRLCKYLPQTVEMAQAVEHDERTLAFTDVGTIMAEGHGIDVDEDDAIETREIESGADSPPSPRSSGRRRSGTSGERSDSPRSESPAASTSADEQQSDEQQSET